MTAKDYYEKYHIGLTSCNSHIFTNTMFDLMMELSDEVIGLIRERNIIQNEALISVIKEINQKYDAVCTLLDANYGTCSVQRNAFLTYWMTEMPELNGCL